MGMRFPRYKATPGHLLVVQLGEMERQTASGLTIVRLEQEPVPVCVVLDVGRTGPGLPPTPDVMAGQRVVCVRAEWMFFEVMAEGGNLKVYSVPFRDVIAVVDGESEVELVVRHHQTNGNGTQGDSAALAGMSVGC